MIKKITILLCLYLMHGNIHAQPLRIVFVEKSNQVNREFFFLIDNEFSYIKYNLEGDFFKEIELSDSETIIISGKLGSKKNKWLVENLRNVGILDWNKRYMRKSMSENGRVYCHSSWNIDLAFLNEIRVLVGYCSKPDTYDDFKKIIHDLVHDKVLLD